MNTSFKYLASLFVMILFLLGCSQDDDDYVPDELRINNFIWKGMNQYYLWQNEVTDLRDDRFGNQGDLNTFLATFTNPATLFQSLRVDATTDKYSVIYSDYTVLEGVLSGTTKNNGIDYTLKYKTGSTTDLFGFVQYILPNSDAAAKNVQRGQLFYAINGVSLTATNYKSLLANDTYTMHFADFANGAITPNGQSVVLTKSVLTENPVGITSVINQGAKRIGYLVYNGFYSGYENELNAAFGQLKNQNVTHLILDLRYNSGGSIATAARLASMITGQFSGQLFAKQQWNGKLQNYWLQTNPNQLNTNFTNSLANGSGINSLHLSKVYVLTTKGTASASELVINGLKPYIQVIQIGDVTIGKNVGSVTLYDSSNFSSTGKNPNHKYAMQPIVLKTSNASGFGDYQLGLQPTILQVEDLGNVGVLGDPSEPLLQTALNYIMATGKTNFLSNGFAKEFVNLKDPITLENEMFVEIKQ